LLLMPHALILGLWGLRSLKKTFRLCSSYLQIGIVPI
jgi:hypothetical protein